MHRPSLPKHIATVSPRQWFWLRLACLFVAVLTLIYHRALFNLSRIGRFSLRKAVARQNDPFAYVLYATQDDYACSALVNIQIIQRTTSHPIYCLVTESVSDTYLDAFRHLGVETILEKPPPLNQGIAYYADALTKLLAFKMHHHVPHLRRVITMDADQLVLADLDHLFLLPPVPFAAPHAYWIEHGPISSTLMVIELSDTTWERVEEGMRTIGSNKYDMDLVEEIFRDDALMLPGQFASINSHWEAWDLPSWFTGAGSLEKISEEDRSSAEVEERFIELFRQSQVMHFYAVGKPWTWSTDMVKSSRPNAHWLLAKQFEMWQERADRICPPSDSQMYKVTVAQDDYDYSVGDEEDEGVSADSSGGATQQPGVQRVPRK